MEELTIGQRIAMKRRELGLSQIDLGERMGVSRQSVSKWEADGAIPEIDKLIALSRLFGVTVGWLLGVEDGSPTGEAPESEFSQREWEIIDRLTQNEPKLPKWLLPLTAGAAAVSLCAAILGGSALFSAWSRKAELASISQSVSDLTISLGGGLQDPSLLDSYSFVAEASADLQECTFHFTGTPPRHEEDHSAQLLVVLDGDTVIRQDCRWAEGQWVAEFTVPIENGYTAAFCLNSGDDIIRTSRVYDPLLYNLLDQQGWGTVSAEYGSWDYDGEALTLSDLHIIIEPSGLYRDTDDLWVSCDLVVLGDREELGRLDLMNRSKYSRTVNFSGTNVDFFTKGHAIPIGPVSGIRNLEVLLVAELSTGIQVQTSVALFHPSSWIIS